MQCMPGAMRLSHELRRLITASAAASTLFAISAHAQTSTAAAQGPELQEIVVTGSLIKRTDTETPSPVQIITDQDLKNSGYTNVVDVLRNLSANGSGTLSQGFGQAFAAGASGIALRGLSVGDTLTLIDGERMVSYPLSDDGERSFVDVTAIPFNAVESVEVLKDGGSAVYGADAIAGVVNVKLKKTYVGAEFTMEMGTTHTNWSSLPGGMNTEPGAIGASSLVYPDSTTGYLINPTTPNGAGVYPNGLPAQVFLPGCEIGRAHV